MKLLSEQYFSVVLFIMLYKVVLTFESVYKILKCDRSNAVLSLVQFMLYFTNMTVSIQLKAIVQCFPMVPFIGAIYARKNIAWHNNPCSNTNHSFVVAQ